jgi:hypothetical protein
MRLAKKTQPCLPILDGGCSQMQLHLPGRDHRRSRPRLVRRYKVHRSLCHFPTGTCRVRTPICAIPIRPKRGPDKDLFPVLRLSGAA